MGNTHMEATQINYRGGAKKMNVEDAIKSAIELTPEQKTNINKIPTIEAAVATKTDQAVIAPEFDAESGIYAIGDLVMHEGKLYEFTSAHETAGEWNSTEVSEKTVADEVDSLMSGLTNIGTILDGEHDNDTISVETATITALGSVTLTAGKWLVLGSINWAANNTGYRQVAFGSGLNPARNGASTTAALTDTGKETYQQVSRIYKVVSTETVTVYGYQTSGSALNAMPYIRAIKISA